MKGRTRLGRAASLFACAAMIACAHPRETRAPEAVVAPPRSAPQWEDAFERIPDVLFVLRPAALRRDSFYGPIIRAALASAAARRTIAASSNMLDAIESCEEVVWGSRDVSEAAPFVLVLRGVRADYDPTRMVDDAGRPLWRAAIDNRAAAPELPSSSDPSTSLFVLPGRTWVIAHGDVRDAARDAFAKPRHGARPIAEDEALARVRIDGVKLAAIEPRIQRGALMPVGTKLADVTIALTPGIDGAIDATFDYDDEAAAKAAEEQLRAIADAFERKSDKAGADDPRWFSGGKVDRYALRVVVRAKIDTGYLSRLRKVYSPTDPNGPRKKEAPPAILTTPPS